MKINTKLNKKMTIRLKTLRKILIYVSTEREIAEKSVFNRQITFWAKTEPQIFSISRFRYSLSPHGKQFNITVSNMFFVFFLRNF